MSIHRRPIMPPSWNPRALPGTCKFCGLDKVKRNKDGSPSKARKYCDDCGPIIFEIFMSTSYSTSMLRRRDGKSCKACGTNGCMDVDHVLPLHLVDREKPDAYRYWMLENKQLLCISCHKEKSAKEAAARAKYKRLNGTTPKRRRGRKIQTRPFQWTKAKKELAA